MSDHTSSEYAGEGIDLPPNPNPHPDWSQDDPAHPGYVVYGLDDTPGPKAYYIHLEAKPGPAHTVFPLFSRVFLSLGIIFV